MNVNEKFHFLIAVYASGVVAAATGLRSVQMTPTVAMMPVALAPCVGPTALPGKGGSHKLKMQL